MLNALKLIWSYEILIWQGEKGMLLLKFLILLWNNSGLKTLLITPVLKSWKFLDVNHKFWCPWKMQNPIFVFMIFYLWNVVKIIRHFGNQELENDRHITPWHRIIHYLNIACYVPYIQYPSCNLPPTAGHPRWMKVWAQHNNLGSLRMQECCVVYLSYTLQLLVQGP